MALRKNGIRHWRSREEGGMEEEEEENGIRHRHRQDEGGVEEVEGFQAFFTVLLDCL